MTPTIPATSPVASTYNAKNRFSSDSNDLTRLLFSNSNYNYFTANSVVAILPPITSNIPVVESCYYWSNNNNLTRVNSSVAELSELALKFMVRLSVVYRRGMKQLNFPKSRSSVNGMTKKLGPQTHCINVSTFQDFITNIVFCQSSRKCRMELLAPLGKSMAEKGSQSKERW